MLLEAIEAMRLRREAKRGATMRPASQARRAGQREAIASMRLWFVGRVRLQPANLAGKFGPHKLDKK